MFPGCRWERVINRSRLRAESGFTLVEVMVAALILFTGVSGTLALVDGANSATSSAKEVEGATNLAREITEQSRSLSYGSVTPASLAAQLQLASPDLASTSPAPDWTVNRRGIVYRVEVAVCSIDDPKDGSGAPTAGVFCPNLGPTSTLASDPVPEDSKRVSVAVSWQRGGAARRYVRQVVTLSPRGADGPGVASLVAKTPVFPDPAAPVVASAAVTGVTFEVTADPRATSVVYSVDGVDRGTATKSGGVWTFTLSLSGWTDRSYEIGARASAGEVAGNTYIIPLVLNRYPAAPPSGLVAGVNKVYVGGTETLVTELDWVANSEANVVGYRAYRPNGSVVCPTGSAALSPESTSCTDFSPANGRYSVVAVYKDATGTLRESAPATAALSPSAVRSFYFRNATANTGFAGCPAATAKRDMLDTFTGDTNSIINFAGNPPWRFCSQRLSAGTTFLAGPGRLVAFFSNSNNKPCSVTPSMAINGTSPLTMTAQTVPAGSGVARYDWTFSIPALTLAANDQVTAAFSTPSGRECDKTDLHYSGTTYRSRLELPAPGYDRPAPPTGLTATQTSNGLRLVWQAPTSGPTPAFYRIYRGGYNYANRYDQTGDNSTSYVDPDRAPGSNTYYVTTVSDTLGESVPAPLAPAVFP